MYRRKLYNNKSIKGKKTIKGKYCFKVLILLISISFESTVMN